MLGLREVTKHLKLRRVKLVIISPNLEKIQSKGIIIKNYMNLICYVLGSIVLLD